jgi:hypothetical protein
LADLINQHSPRLSEENFEIFLDFWSKFSLPTDGTPCQASNCTLNWQITGISYSDAITESFSLVT